MIGWLARRCRAALCRRRLRRARELWESYDLLVGTVRALRAEEARR